MTVNELIEELRKYPGDMKCLVCGKYEDFYSPDIEEHQFLYIKESGEYAYPGTNEKPNEKCVLIW